MLSEPTPGSPGDLGNPEEAIVPEAPTDRQLLERFVQVRDEAAFAALVERHGPMVLSVCRRVLPDADDANDAFQATFLVLVRKADSLKDPDTLAGWLYGVAYRTAQNARVEAARRSHHERQAAAVRPDPAYDDSVDRLLPLLDQELQRLPEKYRAPLVLCYLEGKTHVEAARQLGWPVGSMSSRLARGRELLRNRLTARQQAMLVAFFAGTWTANQRATSVPPPLANATVKAAVGLAGEERQRRAVVLSPSVSSLMEGSLRGLSAERGGRSLLAVILLLSATAVGSGIGLAGSRHPVEAGQMVQPTALDTPSRPPTGPARAIPAPVPVQGTCRH
jgi:RNA polymerase sigma factor (sigma-70 family)